MKKGIVYLLAVTLLLTTLSGCSSSSASKNTGAKPEQTSESQKTDQTKQNQSSQNSSTQSKGKVTVIAPSGWEKIESPALAQYAKGAASFIVTADVVPASVNNNSDEYVKFTREIFEKSFKNASFSDAQKITIDGIEGREFTFTTTEKMKMRIIYLLKDGMAYTITCGAIEKDYDMLSKEYNAFIESFKLL